MFRLGFIGDAFVQFSDCGAQQIDKQTVYSFPAFLFFVYLGDFGFGKVHGCVIVHALIASHHQHS